MFVEFAPIYSLPFVNLNFPVPASRNDQVVVMAIEFVVGGLRRQLFGLCSGDAGLLQSDVARPGVC